MKCKCKCGCSEAVVNGSVTRLWTSCFGCGTAWLDGARKHGPRTVAERGRVAKVAKRMAAGW